MTETLLFRNFSPQAWKKKKLAAKVMLFFYPKTLDISCQIFFLTFIESFHKLIGYLSLNDDLKNPKAILTDRFLSFWYKSIKMWFQPSRVKKVN